MKPEIKVLYDPKCDWWEWHVYHPNGNKAPFYEAGFNGLLIGALTAAYDRMVAFHGESEDKS